MNTKRILIACSALALAFSVSAATGTADAKMMKGKMMGHMSKKQMMMQKKMMMKKKMMMQQNM